MAGANEMTAQEKRPPEPTFYDEPEKMINLKPLNHWFKKHWLLSVVISGFLIILILPFLSSKSGSKIQRTVKPEEKRETVSRESMEQAIEQASTNKKTLVKSVQRTQDPRSKRNYATDIEVFVYKDEKQSLESARSRNFIKTEPLGIPSGTRIPALLSNRIFSFNVAAPVVALIDRDFKWKDNVVIPKGSKFLGEASIVKSIDRINVSFDILIFPDGKELKVRAMALSADGSGGIKGKVQKHRDIKALKAVGEALLGGVSLFAGGVRRDPFSMEDQLRLNLTQNLTSQAAQDLRSVRVDQSITAEAYTPIDVMILEKV
jgi:type IV secretory pathway VirB10-like protein